MDVRFINPFIVACVEAMRQELDSTIRRTNARLTKVAEIKGEVGILMRFTGDFSGSVLVDIPRGLLARLAERREIPTDDPEELKGDDSPLMTMASVLQNRALELLAQREMKQEAVSPVIITPDNALAELPESDAVEISLPNSEGVLSRLWITDLSQAYFANDTILLYRMPHELIEQTIYGLVPLGFVVNAVDDFNHMQTYLQTRSVDYIVWADPEGRSVKDEAVEARKISMNPKLRIFAFTRNTIDLVGAVGRQIFGVIADTPAENDDFAQKLKIKLSTHGLRRGERRSEVRIYIHREEDQPTAELVLPNATSKVPVKVTDISVNGLAFRLIDNDPEVLERIRSFTGVRVNVNLKGNYVFADGSISHRTGMKAGIRFEHLATSSMRHLTQYIADATSLLM